VSFVFFVVVLSSGIRWQPAVDMQSLAGQWLAWENAGAVICVGPGCVSSQSRNAAMDTPRPELQSPELDPVTTTVSTAETVETAPPTLLERLHRALGPLAGGIIIDFVDFATFGPIGLVLGPVLGGMAGWWVSSIYNFGTRGRVIVATLAAIYCTIPFTELLPLATLVAAVARFFETPPVTPPPSES